MKRFISLLLVTVVTVTTLVACANYDFAEEGNYIIQAKEVEDMIAEGAILVDAREEADYNANHIDGAINIPMSSLTVTRDVKGMLADASEIENCLSNAGVTEKDTLLIYDDSANMKAARIQWSLNYYGNFNVYVVSGGLKSLEKAGHELTTTATNLSMAKYKTGDLQKKLLVSLTYLETLINEDEEGTYIIDTRSSEEFYAGAIPGAIHIEYVWNNYANGEYKSPRDIRLTYLDKGIKPEDKIILYCKSSVRAAQAYTALKDAGYQDVRIYDGAWLEYEFVNGPQAPVDNVTPNPGNGS